MKKNRKIIEDQNFDKERTFYGSHELFVRNCSFDGPEDGESAFKECRHIETEHCFFNLRYPFWHDHGVTVSHSEMTENCRAALWYSDGLTLINCKIIGTQPFCYCKNLKLIDCEMLETDLAFEKSQVEATITTKVDSIKNPLSGQITVPDVGELILDDKEAKAEVITITKNIPINC